MSEEKVSIGEGVDAVGCHQKFKITSRLCCGDVSVIWEGESNGGIWGAQFPAGILPQVIESLTDLQQRLDFRTAEPRKFKVGDKVRVDLSRVPVLREAGFSSDLVFTVIQVSPTVDDSRDLCEIQTGNISVFQPSQNLIPVEEEPCSE